MTSELVARFRQISQERIERVEQDWNQLIQGAVSPDRAQAVRRELHTLKSEAQVVGLAEVALVADKLEALTARAERLSFRVPQELDLAVMMGIRFVALLVRTASDRPVAGIDLDGFVGQVDEVLADASRLEAAPPAGEPPRERAVAPDRLSAPSRRRLGRAAVLAFLESVRATGSAREHLREVWQVLADELSRLGTEALAARVRPHARLAGERARGSGKEVEIALALPDDRRVPTEVAEALDAALPEVLDNAIRHGVEPPAARRAAGKELPARVSVRCELGANDGELILVVEDDGGGVDLAAVRRRVAELDLIAGRAAPSRAELLELLFHPRVSTRRDRAAGAGLEAVRAALSRVGGEVTLFTADGQGTTVRLCAPRAGGRLAVHSFTACGGLDLPLAVPAAWTVAPIEGNPVAVDPLAALLPDAAPRAVSGGFALRLTRGRFDLCWLAVGPVRQTTAERIGAPLDDQPAEVVRIEGREALLLRPELS